MTTTRRLATSILVAAGLAASANPALARPFDINANGSYVPAGSPSMHTQGFAPSRGPTIVRVSLPATGFDWDDAAIGAAAGFAISMIGVGGALVASQRRGRRTHGTALTS